ncbi:MAG TPA: DedA family protein [Ktedonobacterales bacterium]
MLELIQELAQWLLNFYHAHQLPALFLLVLIEEAGIPIPIPGDTLVMIAGLQPHRTLLYDVGVIGLASLAVFIGSSILYAVMRRGGRPFLQRYGKYLHLHPDRLDRIERWFLKRGRIAIVLGRLIPGLRIPTTVIAGLSGLPYREYAQTCAIAAVIWSTVFFYLGVLLQRELHFIAAILADLIDYISAPVVYVTLLLILAIGGGGLHIHRRVRSHRRRLRAQTRADAERRVADGQLRVRQPDPYYEPDQTATPEAG